MQLSSFGLVIEWISFKISGNYWYWHDEFDEPGWWKWWKQ